jgi:hypothetical protein
MKKLVYLLSCLFLLSAGFTACSSDYDDPPEQPESHQNETPMDSTTVDKDTTEVDSVDVDTVIYNDGDSLPMLEVGRSWNYVRTHANGMTDKVSLKLTESLIIGSDTAYKLAYCTPEDTMVRYAISLPAFYMKKTLASLAINQFPK